MSCVKEGDMQVNINHQTKSITFGSALVVALKEEIENGPYIQVIAFFVYYLQQSFKDFKSKIYIVYPNTP